MPFAPACLRLACCSAICATMCDPASATRTACEEIESLSSSMEEEGQAAVVAGARAPEAIVIERAADMRYTGQEHAVTVELPGFFVERDRDAIKRRFDKDALRHLGAERPRTSSYTTSAWQNAEAAAHRARKQDSRKRALRITKEVFFRGHDVDACVGAAGSPERQSCARASAHQTRLDDEWCIPTTWPLDRVPAI